MDVVALQAAKADAKKRYGPARVTVADYIAQSGMKISGHRGSPATHPEHSPEGYVAAIAAAEGIGTLPFVKTDAMKLGGSPGSYAIMHDTTTNRTTNTTLANDNVSNYDLATIKSLSALTTLYGPNYPTAPRPMLLSEFFDLVGKRAAFSIEPKNGPTEIPAIVAQIVRKGLTEAAIISDNNGTDLNYPALVHAVPGAEQMMCGYTWANRAITDVTPAAVIAAGYKFMGIQGTYSDADITTVVNAAHAAGIKVIGFPVLRREQAARFASLGVDMVDVSDPAYLGTNVPLGPSRFKHGRIQPGFLDHDNTGGYDFVGSPGAYRIQLSGAPHGTGTSTGYQLGFGFLGPLPDTFTFSGTLTWDTAEAVGTSKWMQFWLSVSDKTPNGNVENGYAFKFFQSGQPQILRVDRGAYDGFGNYAAGAGTAIKNGVTGTAPTSGTVLPFTITRAAGGAWTWVINGLTTTVTDNTYVPRYVHVSRSGSTGSAGLAFSLSGLSIA